MTAIKYARLTVFKIKKNMQIISWLFNLIFCLVSSLLKAKKFSRKPKDKVTETISPTPISQIRNRKKPKWVVDKIIYLKVIMPDNGCGSIANTFNRLYLTKGESVSKTFVYEKLKAHAYQVKCKRRDMKSRCPKASAINVTWGIDLTTINIDGRQRLILGIIVHASRALLCLQELKSKHSIIILREVIQTIKLYGFSPKIRTDNETCFTSKLIKLALKLLTIKRQTTDIACPWQNGRIERCFGTFKQKWRQVTFNPPLCQLQTELNIYQTWYNIIRTYSNLDGRTPAEIFTRAIPNGKAKLVTAWDGVLVGYYFPD